ncbi:MAG: Gfo/Idh/MocA family oxidoreductase [Nitrospirae bacterium]|nr:Gfo/Idh/MocA family oxidoreductase [Nitrospirota bacterium]
MKALVVGCGASGRRHISNLLQLKNIGSISVYTENKECLKGLKGDGKINTINALDNIEADFAIIANETYRHIDTALSLAAKGMDLFIEKPLSYNQDKADELKEIAKKKKIKIFVGYNLRYLGAMKYVKDRLSEKIIGDLYFAKIEVGQFLPLWRPDRDYRDSYSASKAKGGGVALDLSHEIDYMRYLFGDPCNWKVLKARASKLEIDSDDVFEGIYRYDNNFICNVHMDYLQKDKKREIRIVGSEGMLHCDLIGKSIRIIKGDKEIVMNDRDMFDIDRTYMDELKHFIGAAERDIIPDITLDDGIKALELLEDGKR